MLVPTRFLLNSTSEARFLIDLDSKHQSLRVTRVTRVSNPNTSEEKMRPRVGRDGFGVTRCGLEGDIHVGSDPIFLLKIPPREHDFSPSWTRNNRVVREKWREKSGLRLLSVFLAFFGPSAQFARDKLRVGGDSCWCPL